MIDFSSCDRAIEYIDRGEYDKLRRFINRERKKYYLGIATGALRKYMKQNPDLQGRFVYGYLDEDSRDLGKLLIANGYSGYFLNQDILNPSLKEKGIIVKPGSKPENDEEAKGWAFQSFFTEMYRDFLAKAVEVEEMRKKVVEQCMSKSTMVVMTAQGKTIEHHFSGYGFSFTEQFLGDGRKGDIRYKLYPDFPIYLAESSMGKCFVYGFRRNK